MRPSGTFSPLRTLLLLTALATLLPAPPAAPQEPDPAANSGLPPAPPPTGIRPSRSPAPPPPSAPAPAAPQAARRAASRAFDLALTVEVREIERLVDLDGDPGEPGVAALNAAAGGEPIAVDPRLAELLARANSFCLWSGQAHGPLGGRLYASWGLHGGVATARPAGEGHRQAVRSAACGLLQVDAEAATARLAADSRVDLWGFAHGFAVDRAVEVLREHGAGNAYVELGQVRRAIGPGPGEEGRGWPALLPVFPGLDGPLDRVWLLDESLAVASAVHRPLVLAGDRYAPYVDQRSGRPPEGMVGAVASSGLAVDAEALAATMLILGNREGMLRAGSLTPKPAVLWLLGSGEGAPVVSQYNWTKLSLQ